MKDRITLERLKQVLHYDPETGLFTWLTSPKWNIPAGSIASGSTDTGYRFIKINSKIYLSHRLALFYMTGVWPVLEIDHINGERSDNRYCNIREVCKSDNLLNRKRYASNTSGAKGVTWAPKRRKWRARVQKFGMRYDLGFFNTVEEAKAAYEAGAKEKFGDYCRAPESLPMAIWK